jgi:hypothetical protein
VAFSLVARTMVSTMAVELQTTRKSTSEFQMAFWLISCVYSCGLTTEHKN